MFCARGCEGQSVIGAGRIYHCVQAIDLYTQNLSPPHPTATAMSVGSCVLDSSMVKAPQELLIPLADIHLPALVIKTLIVL